MAKKFGKFLMFTAAVGAVAAGAYYYMQNKNDNHFEDDDDFDDFDDFDEDLDDDTDSNSSTKERSYVSLNLDDTKLDEDSAVTAEKKEEEPFIPETGKKVDKVEEFFDDDEDDTDNSMDAM